jgi:hypothetical protein
LAEVEQEFPDSFVLMNRITVHQMDDEKGVEKIRGVDNARRGGHNLGTATRTPISPDVVDRCV